MNYVGLNSLNEAKDKINYLLKAKIWNSTKIHGK